MNAGVKLKLQFINYTDKVSTFFDKIKNIEPYKTLKNKKFILIVLVYLNVFEKTF